MGTVKSLLFPRLVQFCGRAGKAIVNATITHVLFWFLPWAFLLLPQGRLLTASSRKCTREDTN
jgi:hypothetical protein